MPFSGQPQIIDKKHVEHGHAQYKPGESHIANVDERTDDVHVNEPGLKVVQGDEQDLEI
jgi:hypothetical protein